MPIQINRNFDEKWNLYIASKLIIKGKKVTNFTIRILADVN